MSSTDGPDTPSHPLRRVSDYVSRPVDPVPHSPPMPEISEKSSKVAEQLQKALKILTAATVGLYIFVLMLGFWVWQQSNRNTDALCALRDGVQQQNKATQQFLTDNPGGVAGIPAEALKVSLANTQRTIDALKNLHC